MKQYRTILFFYLFFFSFAALAHENTADSLYAINGRVVDSENKPLQKVSALLISFTDTTKRWSMATNENGEFVHKLPEGYYRLKLSCIGYTPLSTTVKVKADMEILPIVMQRQNTTLPEVSVVAKRTVYDIDGYTTKISVDQMFRKRSVNEILPFLPGILKNGDMYTVFGRPVAVIYVDNKRIRIDENRSSSLLFSLLGKRIDRIRVDNNIGVEGGNTLMGKAVIYITTIKVDNGGYASFGNRMSVGKYFRSNAPSADLMWNYGKLSVNLSVSDSKVWGKPRPDYSGTSFFDTNLHSESVQKSLFKMKHSPDLSLGAFFDFTKKDKLSVEVDAHHISNQSFWDSETSVVKGVNLGSILQTSDTTRLNSNSIEGYMDFTHHWSKGYWCFYSELKHSYSHTDNWAVMKDNVGALDSRLKNQQTRLTVSATGFQARQRVAKAAWLRYGVGYVRMIGRFRTFLEERNLRGRDDYDYSENLYKGYASYNQSLDRRFDYSLGLRYEYTQATPNSLSSSSKEHNNYAAWLGQAKLRYVLNEKQGHSISLSYNRNILRPHMTYLNPAKRWISDVSYSTGNPNLRASIDRDVEIALSLYAKYWLTVNYNNGRNLLNVYKKVVGENLYCYAPEYGLHRESWAVRLNAPVKLSEKVRLNTGLAYSFFKENYDNLRICYNAFGGQINMMADLPWNVSSSFGLSYNSPSRGVYSKTSARGSASIDMSRPFGPFRVALGGYYSLRTTTRLRAENFESWSRTDCFESLRVNLSVSYSLSWGKMNDYNFKEKKSNELNRF